MLFVLQCVNTEAGSATSLTPFNRNRGRWQERKQHIKYLAVVKYGRVTKCPAVAAFQYHLVAIYNMKSAHKVLERSPHTPVTILKRHPVCPKLHIHS
jgi:hypothetical protein